MPDPTPTPDPVLLPADPPADPPEKTFVQAEVDRIVQERLNRQRSQFSNYDELKEKADRYDEMAEASKTEQQKLQEAAETAQKQAAEAIDRANRTLRKSAIIAEAAKAQAVDPNEVHALLADSDFSVTTEDGTELKVTIGDDGQVTGVKEVVETFLAPKQHLVGQSRRPDFDGGSRKAPPTERQLSREDLARMSPEDVVKAEKDGRLNTVLGRT